MVEHSPSVTNVLARMNALWLGASCSIFMALALGTATLVLVLQGSESSYHLNLLVQFFPGYSVTAGGAVVGALWAAAVTFVSTTPVAWLYYRNLLSKLPDDEVGAEPSDTTGTLQDAVLRLKKREFAMAIGLLAGTAMFVATTLLIINHDPGKPLGPHLKLLGHFLPGYKITWTGSVLGFVYLSVLGGGAALFVAAFYNRLVEASEK